MPATCAWPPVHGGPPGSALLRAVAEDFIVDEQLPFAPSASGEHVFVRIEKANANTAHIARLLARHAGVRERDIGYAGLKDRHALTRQWFSVWLPGRPDPDWPALETDSLRVVQAVRHHKKLQRGTLAANRFQITLRAWQGDQALTEERLRTIRARGIANYFGPQRFGHDGGNLELARALFQGKRLGRQVRSLALSAARAFLFNQLLALRVGLGVWDRALAGDVFMFAGANACFHAAEPDADILRRLEACAIHPSGPLAGTGPALASGQALALERQVLALHPELAAGLAAANVACARRPLRANVPDLTWAFTPDRHLRLAFTLPPGSYATTLLAEVAATGETPAADP